MLTTDQKGAIAETAIIHAATKLGIVVYKPVMEGGRCDFVFDVGQLVRVQCKWANRYGDVVVIPCRSGRRTREGIVNRVYTPDEIDAFAAYCAELDRCFFVPIHPFAGQTAIWLRLRPPRNNQKIGVTSADDFDFAATLLREFGAVAQLGERLAGSQKGTGSSPVGSTSERAA